MEDLTKKEEKEEKELTIEQKKEQIITFVEQYKCKFIEIDDPESIDKVYSLLIKKELKNVTKAKEYLYYGFYFHYVEPDQIKLKYFYSLGKEVKEPYCILNLAHYYKKKKKMNKYEKLMENACDLGLMDAIRSFATYYCENKQYDLMGKYFTLAIQKGNIDSMIDYGLHFYHVKDYEKAQSCLDLAIIKGSVLAVNYLVTILWELEKFDEVVEYLLIGIKLNSDKSMYYLAKYYLDIRKDFPEFRKYVDMAISLGNIDAMIMKARYLNGVEQDDFGCEKYLRMACENSNNVIAMCELAHILLYKRKDLEGAIQYYSKAVALGSIVAMADLAFVFQTELKDYGSMKELYDKVINFETDKESNKNVKMSCLIHLMSYYKDVEKNDEKYKFYQGKLHELMDVSKYMKKVTDCSSNVYTDSIKPEQHIRSSFPSSYPSSYDFDYMSFISPLHNKSFMKANTGKINKHFLYGFSNFF
ncbi:MAG: hypothetical protein Barrevirus12_6 [Barrevirus sp.]|uniref:TPR repeat protein n=1 Tax=Barrevirus sp. TaxID=2487763 RepID=A0A3G4ZQE6_9VIRU|nr:MAG: hypothetical protein Barrevirus12_6 [Barrevirus sp.]